jgi:hypothetical protein
MRKTSCHAQHGCRLRIRAWLRLPDKRLESCPLRHIQVAPRLATLSWEAKGPCGGAGLAQLGRKGNATKRIAGPLGFPSQAKRLILGRVTGIVGVNAGGTPKFMHSHGGSTLLDEGWNPLGGIPRHGR